MYLCHSLRKKYAFGQAAKQPKRRTSRINVTPEKLCFLDACGRTFRLRFSFAQVAAIVSLMIYGYARGSTDGQDVDAQVKQLRAAGAEKVFRETAGRAQADRAQLRRLLAQIGRGDVLIVTRLIHIARSTRDLFNTLEAITDKGAGFRSLADIWADTTTAKGYLMLTVLGGLGEFERELSRTRTSEGGRAGRPLKLTTDQRKEAIMRRDRGEETLVEIGRSYNVNASTIARLKL
jgi:DNA invertase Pin-like site-specific DNA recombinase